MKPFTYQKFREIYSQVPRLCVEVLIQTKEGVLLTLRSKYGYENQWHIPGGTVLYKESLIKAVVRVSREELGITVNPLKMVGYIEYFSEEKERGFGFTVGIVFLCKLSEQKAFKLDNQSTKACFFSTLPQNLVSEQKSFLKKNLSTLFSS